MVRVCLQTNGSWMREYRIFLVWVVQTFGSIGFQAILIRVASAVTHRTYSDLEFPENFKKCAVKPEAVTEQSVQIRLLLFENGRHWKCR